jgi:hypothetical protein
MNKKTHQDGKAWERCKNCVDKQEFGVWYVMLKKECGVIICKLRYYMKIIKGWWNYFVFQTIY